MSNRNQIQIKALSTTETDEGSLADYALFVVAGFALMSWLVLDVITPLLR